MGIRKMNKAVFLDRDGVINDLVLNPRNRRYESPYRPADLRLCRGCIDALRVLQRAGYMLFVVSNQPSYARGKARLSDLRAVQNAVHARILRRGVRVTEYYYCYHHPQGRVKGYSGPCECRKPKPFFLKKARLRYGIDLAASWMIGDRDTDIACGRNAGARTILIQGAHSQDPDYGGACKPDATAGSLREAAAMIVSY
jgi:D-glycero-D-manno-heptose 1,7-bisphosphate phosphatase